MTRVEIAVSSGLLRVARNGGGNFAALPLLFPKIFCKQNIFGNTFCTERNAEMRHLYETLA